MKRLALVALAWVLSTAPGCQPAHIVVHDWYIRGSGDAEDGPHILPPTQTSLVLAQGKPYPGPMACAIAWLVVAVDAAGSALPAACQPTNLTADGASWDGL